MVPILTALGRFLEAKGISPAEASRQIGVSRAAMSVWLHAAQRPRPEMRMRIAKWTRQAVPVEAWMTDEERQAVHDVRPSRAKRAAGAA